MSKGYLIAAAFGAWIAGAGILQAAVITVPNSAANASVGSANVFPFTFASTLVPSMRYQQVFDASQFSAIASGGEFLTQVAFRREIDSEPFSISIAEIQINLSTTAAKPDQLSFTFVDNVGSDDTVVLDQGPLTLASTFVGPQGTLTPFDVSIVFDRPFFYDPAEGNLLLDVRNFSGGSLNTSLEVTGEALSRVFRGDVFATTAPTDNSTTVGLVTQFSTQVPEPTAEVLFAVGLAAFVANRRIVGRRWVATFS